MSLEAALGSVTVKVSTKRITVLCTARWYSHSINRLSLYHDDKNGILFNSEAEVTLTGLSSLLRSVLAAYPTA